MGRAFSSITNFGNSYFTRIIRETNWRELSLHSFVALTSKEYCHLMNRKKTHPYIVKQILPVPP